MDLFGGVFTQEIWDFQDETRNLDKDLQVWVYMLLVNAQED